MLRNKLFYSAWKTKFLSISLNLKPPKPAMLGCFKHGWYVHVGVIFPAWNVADLENSHPFEPMIE